MRTESLRNAGKQEQQKLLDLLAIIHADGGHYTAEHGLLKSTEDAIKKVWEMKQQIAERGG
jgi:hypothetical protein